jgi:CheY-like chemotaxis protein
MISPTHLKQRILDELNQFAPSLEVVQMNQRATTAMQERVLHAPEGVEAVGFEDILRVRQKLRYLYWHNTLGHHAATSASGGQDTAHSLTDLTIVIVDDDLDILEFLEMLLTSEGLTVTTSDHTGDVSELIRQVQPDVVLLDLQTPEDRRAGLVVLAHLRAESETCLLPVLLLTADHGALRQHAADLLELGAVPLSKPFEVDHLLQLIALAIV